MSEFPAKVTEERERRDTKRVSGEEKKKRKQK